MNEKAGSKSKWDGNCRRGGARRVAERRKAARRMLDTVYGRAPEADTVENLIAQTEQDVEAAIADGEGLC